MDRKKTFLILLLVMLIIVAGIVFYGLKTPKEVTDQNNSQANSKPVATNLFSQNTDSTKKTVSLTGTADKIEEKTLIIKDATIATIVNINGATPVMLKQKDGTLKAGQIANLRINDSIKVEYDLETKDVQLITITIKK